jgi:hypothetical protein
MQGEEQEFFGSGEGEIPLATEADVAAFLVDMMMSSGILVQCPKPSACKTKRDGGGEPTDPNPPSKRERWVVRWPIVAEYTRDGEPIIRTAAEVANVAEVRDWASRYVVSSFPGPTPPPNAMPEIDCLYQWICNKLPDASVIPVGYARKNVFRLRARVNDRTRGSPVFISKTPADIYLHDLPAAAESPRHMLTRREIAYFCVIDRTLTREPLDDMLVAQVRHPNPPPHAPLTHPPSGTSCCAKITPPWAG